jgi:hypothetical protein
MVSRRFSAWQKVVAVAPLLLLALSLPAEALLRCQMDGLLRPSCCCPSQSEAPSSLPVVKTAGCCEREVMVATPIAGEGVRRSAADLFSATFVELPLPLAFATSEEDRVTAARSSQGPPRNGPSIVVLKHAFLI